MQDQTTDHVRGVNAVGTEAVSRAGPGVCLCEPMNVVLAAHHRQARRLFLASVIEQAEIDLRGVAGIDSELHSVFRSGCAFGENGWYLHGLSLRRMVCLLQIGESRGKAE